LLNEIYKRTDIFVDVKNIVKKILF